MHLIPTNDEVIDMLRETGALREGHFEYPNGMHADEFLQVALAFRYYEYAKILSVGLSRRLRADPEIRAMIKQLSIVCPTTGGLPIGYGVCEALGPARSTGPRRTPRVRRCDSGSSSKPSPARRSCWWTTFSDPGGVSRS